MQVTERGHIPVEDPTQEKEEKGYQSLLSEMRYLHTNYSREGLPRDWRLLSKTGFSVQGQVDMLYSDLDGTTYKDRKDVLERWLVQTEEDTKGFIIEYLTQKLTFPIYLEAAVVDNKKTIIAPRYGGKRMVDIVLEEERNGSVKRTLEKKIEPFLLNSPEGSIAVLTSPDGWSGLKTDMRKNEGEDIIFPDSQTQIYQKKGDTFVGFTVRTDLKLEEHREVMRRLGGIPPEVDDVCQFVSAANFINAKDAPGVRIEEVVKTMQEARVKISKREDAYKGRSWDEVYTDLQNRENLWKFDDVTVMIFEEYKKLVKEYPFTREELEEATGVMILRIARALGVDSKGIKEKGSQVSQAFASVGETKMLPILAYGNLLKEVADRGGCAGGGTSAKGNVLQSPVDVILQSYTARLAKVGVESGESYNYDQPGPCRVCNEDVNCGPCKLCRPCDMKIQAEEARMQEIFKNIEMPLVA